MQINSYDNFSCEYDVDRHNYNSSSTKFPAKLFGPDENVVYYNQIAMYLESSVREFLDSIAA